jgi:hypothetical protein
MNLETFGGRRFLMTMVSGAGTWLLTWFGKVDGSIYSVVTIATVAAYITGNTVQKSAQIKADGESKGSTP